MASEILLGCSGFILQSIAMRMSPLVEGYFLSNHLPDPLKFLLLGGVLCLIFETFYFSVGNLRKYQTWSLHIFNWSSAPKLIQNTVCFGQVPHKSLHFFLRTNKLKKGAFKLPFNVKMLRSIKKVTKIGVHQYQESISNSCVDINITKASKYKISHAIFSR